MMEWLISWHPVIMILFTAIMALKEVFHGSMSPPARVVKGATAIGLQVLSGTLTGMAGSISLAPSGRRLLIHRF